MAGTALTISTKFVLDTTAFCEASALPKGRLLYPTQVADELKSRGTRLRAELSGAKPIFVKKEFLAKAEAARKQTGDRLSPADISVLACAIQEKATVVSDDYGVQNTARELGLEILVLSKRGISEQWSYEYKCKGCGRVYLQVGICPDCGNRIKRKRV